MAEKNDAFLKKLLATFRVEADEHLKAMSSGLIELEKTPAGERWSDAIETVYREAHSLKGAARAVNLAEVESMCHSLESVFAGLKSGLVAASAPLFDLLHQALDALGAVLAADARARGKDPKPAVTAWIQRLDEVLKGAVPEELERKPQETPGVPGAALQTEPAAASTAASTATPPIPSHAPETIRVAIAKLDSVMRRAEELLGPRLAVEQRSAELRETGALLADWKKRRARVQPVLRAIDRSAVPRKNGAAKGKPELAKVLDYLEADDLSLKALEDRLTKMEKAAERDQRSLAGMTDSLLQDVKEMHMMPFSTLLEAFPRLTRELARGQGKQVELTMQGEEIEIDRRILEEMKDPLMHLIRNCIDHGFEKPAVREQNGKPPRGTLAVDVSHKDNNRAQILVRDDGAGIDVAAVSTAAARLGLLSADEAEQADEREVLALVFKSGVSTSPIITDLSGRGLGLAIVREKVERLGGAVELETRPGAGTSLRIELPLTLATFRGVLVRADDRLFVIPATHVERAARVANEEIQTVENRETIRLDGRAISFAWLADALEIDRKSAASQSADNALVVVLGLGAGRVAFRVDELLGEQEVLVKGLGPQLARVRNVSGATVLGTGQVVPVLNAPDLMRSAMKAVAPRVAPAVEKPAAGAKRSILVVEDSITSRALLKNILEAAGYQVGTAVDGIDAYTALKTGAFDLIVSDVEMPRMDGFDFTAKVRADKQLSELPVVLVTAMESREHRERGIDVGANAYIVKSSFDQSNLLEVVGRLI